MCGRFALDAETDELIQEFTAADGTAHDWRPRYSIAPTETVPIVRERVRSATGAIERTVDAAVWDFHPVFLGDSTRPNINARLERILSSGLWKRAFTSSRALLPMRGYYEWTGEAGRKRAYFLRAGDGGLLAAAGIYAVRKRGDDWEVSTAIITRPARDASGEIHDRMPVFLQRSTWDDYLAPGPLDGAAGDEMVALLAAESERTAGNLTSHEVDRRVNSARTIDPEDATLIEPLEG